MFVHTRAAAVAFVCVAVASTAAAFAAESARIVPGTRVAFVADRGFDPSRRHDATITVRLKDALVVGDAVLAAAGTPAQLVVGAVTHVDPQTHERRTTFGANLERFNTAAGLVPLRLASFDPNAVASGTVLDATVAADVARQNGRWNVNVPFPYAISADRPASDYTPTPARTVAPYGAKVAAAPSPVAARVAGPTPAPSPNAAEALLVKRVMADLPRLYPAPADAERAGYVHYSAEDATGAISYANRGDAWTAKDVDRPSQLWYDVHGRLLGADYSILQSDVAAGSKPTVLGIDPSRFEKIGAHVHYVTCEPAGSSMCVYGHGVGGKRWTEAGLDLQHPTAAGLVKIGAVKDASTVKTVFLYPAIWDATVWVLPNPLGPFAETNPNVKPSKADAKGDTTM